MVPSLFCTYLEMQKETLVWARVGGLRGKWVKLWVIRFKPPRFMGPG